MTSQNQSTFIEGHILRRFTVIKKVGSGAYGHVWKVEEKNTKKIFALKKIFDAFQHATDAQRTYRQIEILRQIDHPNIIKLYDTIRADNNRDVYVLFEFMEADLHNVIAEGILKEVHIRFIIYQLAKALKYLHSGKILHRDLKPSNILVNSNCTIKLCDFGLVRSLSQGKDQGSVLTEGVATRWYRSPQVLLGSKSYSTPADIWSFGCIIYEILTQKPLFTGSCTLDQIEKICQFTGYPSQEDINSLQSEISWSMIKEMKISYNTKPANFLKDMNPSFANLLQRILVFNPKKRLTIDEILSHEVIKAFRKKEEEIVCIKEISTSIDDNKKFTVDEYRKLVYGINYIEQKPKALSSSLGSGSVSPKYNTSHNKTMISFNPAKTEYKSEIVKKYSFDKVRPTQANYLQESSKKGLDKPNLKYVRSANHLVKGETALSQGYQKKDHLVHNDTPNKEESDGAKIVHFPKYSISQKIVTDNQKYCQRSAPVSVNNSINSSTNVQMNNSNFDWKQKIPTSSTTMSTNEIKDKVLQFRAAKKISFNNNNNNELLTKHHAPLFQQSGVKKAL